MNNDIKEILEEVNKIVDNTAYNEDFSYFQVSHISKLLDYITNLQDNELGLETKIDILESEILQLKADKKYLLDYKQKIDKIIEYINKRIEEYNNAKNKEDINFLHYSMLLNDLLNILQGD